MTTGLPANINYPTDAATGLTLPLSRSLGSRDLTQHSALVAVELEVLAKKLDRFGWDRDRGTAAHDRVVMDWIMALRDYPLSEIQAACRAHVLAEPGRMPNEGHIVARIMSARKAFVASLPRVQSMPQNREPVDPARAAEILNAAGFTPKRMTAAE